MEVIIESRGNIYDISHICSDIEWKTEFNKVSSLKVSIQKVPNLAYFEGDVIKLIDGDRKLFKGYIVSKERDKQQLITVTARDQLKYFRYKDTVVLKNKTATEIIQHICSKYNRVIGVMDNTGFLIENTIEDNKMLLDIITGAIDKTLIATGKLFVFYDDFGALTLRNVDALKTNIIIGDKNLATDFKYKTSIDEDVYNQIKLFRDNKETGKRDVYIVMDSESIKRWGLLQYSEKVNENMPEGKVRAQAENLLKVKNRLKRSLSIDCLGHSGLRAGNSVALMIKELGDISLNQLMIIEGCTHIVKGSHHTMKLNLLYEG